MTERVLFIDDDPNLLASIKRTMRRGFEVDTAISGGAAMALLEQGHRYAVVVSDIQMPRMNGIDVLRQFKDRTPETIRIVLTGNADQKTAIDAVNQGHVFRFLTKPTAPDELREAVRQGIHEHKLIRLTLGAGRASPADEARAGAALPDRAAFQDRLETALASRPGGGRGDLNVLVVRLTNLQKVIDGIGHDAGETLLQELATRVTAVMPEGAAAARLNDSELAVLVPAGDDTAETVARAILSTMSETVAIDSFKIRIDCSIGIAPARAGQKSASKLIRQAQIAERHARDSGTAIHMYRHAMRDAAADRLAVERGLGDALAHDQLVAHYQPIVGLKDGAITGFEMLVRWAHPERGLLAPDAFIDVAEESAIITEITDWLLTTGCRRLKAWQDAHSAAGAVGLSVNISARDFDSADLTRRVLDAATGASLDPGHLKLEITESSFVENPGAAAEMLGRLRDLGVRILIDDFGTGYSSLSYLHRFPITTMKIDRSFVANMEADESGRGIIETIIALADSLSLDIIAEGIETRNQFEALRAAGVDHGQGFWISRPLSADDAGRLLAEGVRWDPDEAAWQS